MCVKIIFLHKLWGNPINAKSNILASSPTHHCPLKKTDFTFLFLVRKWNCSPNSSFTEKIVRLETSVVIDCTAIFRRKLSKLSTETFQNNWKQIFSGSTLLILYKIRPLNIQDCMNVCGNFFFLRWKFYFLIVLR